MMKAIELYRQALAEIPHPEKGWFAAAINRYRQHHDDESAREVSGRNLHQTLAEAEVFCRHFPDVQLLDAVQDANGALWAAIRSFSGGNLEEFQVYLHQKVQAQLYRLTFPENQ